MEENSSSQWHDVKPRSVISLLSFTTIWMDVSIESTEFVPVTVYVVLLEEASVKTPMIMPVSLWNRTPFGRGGRIE